MAFEVTVSDRAVTIELTGWDRVMCWRREVTVARVDIAEVAVSPRGELEPLIEHRTWGFGTHDGAKRPGRRRVGSMLGRGVKGAQFWAVGAGESTAKLLVVEVASPDFRRFVLEVDDPTEVARTLG